MKKIIAISLMLFGIISISAQTTLIEKIKAANDKVSSITCHFTQSKHLLMMEQAVVSEGTLYYEKGKMCMQYSKPSGDLMLINGHTFTMKANGKQQVVNAEKNAQFNELKNLLMACMQCDINKITNDFAGKTAYQESSDAHTYTLERDKKGKKGFYKVVLKIDKKSLTLNTLEMYEMNENYTVYSMTNKKLNESIDAAVFNCSK